MRSAILLFSCFWSVLAFAQGEDSLPSERDWLVINEMLPGKYANANQAYFEGRTNVDESRRHPGTTVSIERTNAGFVFRTGKDSPERVLFEGSLVHDDAEPAVILILRHENERCRYRWQREAMQFRGKRQNRCSGAFPSEWVLSERELWVYPGPGQEVAEDNPFRLHRARAFSCYADMPGVGGGRDEPYERYDNFKLHDQGGSVWFDTRDEPARRMGITLFQVDWPINNYQGIFTRDSLVIYVSEEFADGSRKEHGYAFTEPDANRVGVNLKWILASCFMKSNRDATPTM